MRVFALNFGKKYQQKYKNIYHKFKSYVSSVLENDKKTYFCYRVLTEYKREKSDKRKARENSIHLWTI